MYYLSPSLLTLLSITKTSPSLLASLSITKTSFALELTQVDAANSFIDWPAHARPAAALRAIFEWFLLGTGRMPHPVGGAMGVTCVTAVKRETPALTSSH